MVVYISFLSEQAEWLKKVSTYEFSTDFTDWMSFLRDA